MKKTHLASLLTATLMTGAPTWAAEPEAASYGARLEGFEYAWPVALHGFESQRQTLEMAYLDIAPTVHSFYAEMLAVLLPEATRCKLYEQASGISLRAPPVA